MKKMVILGAIALSSLLQNPVTAETTSLTEGQNSKSAFMRVYSETLPPIGYVAFCRENPSDCRDQDESRDRIDLTKADRAELDAVNALVNETVQPMTDMEVYGVAEKWAYPTGRGDCEDYVLLKRKLLIERGWPESALLITVVRDENGEGHAVLTVRTAEGDLVLDNKRSEILAWNRTPYTYVKRQSYRAQQAWMSLLPPGYTPSNPVSAAKPR